VTKDQFKQWIVDRFTELEPTIGRPASESEAALISEAKLHAYTLGLHDLAAQLPDYERVKTPLTACNSLKRILAALETETPAEQQTEWLTVRQAATASNLSQRMIYNLCSRGELTHSRVGAAIRIKQTDLARYLAAQRDRLR
jgi:excisionase family DNA binding protein